MHNFYILLYPQNIHVFKPQLPRTSVDLSRFHAELQIKNSPFILGALNTWLLSTNITMAPTREIASGQPVLGRHFGEK